MSEESRSANPLESEFLSKKIPTLFWKYSLFALAGMIFQFLTVFFDGTFVGNGVGQIGLASISIIMPFWTIGLALIMLFGVGASTVAAIKLGTGDKEGARNVYGKLTAFSFLFSAAISILVLLFLNPVLTGLGASAEVSPAARAYMIPFLIGFPFYVAGTVAYLFTRIAEKPFIATLAYTIPAVVSIIAEYYFIFKMDLGMAGSGIAYAICTGCTIFLVPYLQTRTIFKLKASDFKPDVKVILEAIKIGFPQFAINICTAIYAIIVNNLILKYGGTPMETAIFGIVNAYIAFIFVTLTNSFCQGIQPIASYNTGAKLHSRVAALIKVGISQSTIALFAATIVLFTAADSIIKLFAGPDPMFNAAVKSVMVVFLMLYALGNVSQVASAYFIAVEKIGLAIINGISRILIFAVPLLFIMPQIFGLKGIWMAQPGADALAFALALFCLIREYRKLKQMTDGE
jgi:Na+-driven multidrug efflux pump